MSTDRPPTDFLVRTPELDPEQSMHVSHPLNDRSELFMARLSDQTGLSHVGVSMARIPPGKESFTLHVHTIQEEWVFVLSGNGHVRMDDRELAIEAGDFIGFPPNGPAHVIRNTSNADLVYLQGGDRRQGDRGRFPEIGRVGYQHDEGHMALVPEEEIEIRPFSDWLVRP